MKDEIMTVERRGPNPEAVGALLEAILDWLVRSDPIPLRGTFPSPLDEHVGVEA